MVMDGLCFYIDTHLWNCTGCTFFTTLGRTCIFAEKLFIGNKLILQKISWGHAHGV